MSENSGANSNGIILIATFVVVMTIGYSWLKAHDAWTRFEVESQLKDQQIAARDKQAAADREAIEQLKKQAETPQQIVREIPKVITLPAPASAQWPVDGGQSDHYPLATDHSSTGARHALPEAPQPQQSGIYFPPQDAKPLFDRLADCKAMESQLSACQQNYSDMRQERDLAVKARRGSFWQRAKQVGIGIAIGGAIGYAARR